MIQSPLASTKFTWKIPWKLEHSAKTSLVWQWLLSWISYRSNPRDVPSSVYSCNKTRACNQALLVLCPLPTIVRMVMRSSTTKRMCQVHPNIIMSVYSDSMWWMWEVLMSPATERCKQGWATWRKQHITICIILRLTCSCEFRDLYGTLSFIRIPSFVLLSFSAFPNQYTLIRVFPATYKLFPTIFLYSPVWTNAYMIGSLAWVTRATEFQGCMIGSLAQVSKATEFQGRTTISSIRPLASFSLIIKWALLWFKT